MDQLKFVVLILVDRKRLYGYIFPSDLESQSLDNCRFVEHKNIQQYLKLESSEVVKSIDKSDILYIDNNLRF